MEVFEEGARVGHRGGEYNAGRGGTERGTEHSTPQRHRGTETDCFWAGAVVGFGVRRIDRGGGGEIDIVWPGRGLLTESMTALPAPPQHLNLITHDIIGAAIEVHRCLGPGLLESLYRECVCHELSLRNVIFDREVAVSLQYKGLHLHQSYRIDLIVAGSIIVELKSVEKVHPVHQAQVLTYLKLRRLPLGLLINFNVPVLRTGIVRIAN